MITEKNNDKIQTCIEYRIDSKVGRNEETESVGKTNSREKPPPEKSTNFYEIQRKFHDRENDYNEENQVITKDTNIENNNEDNRLRMQYSKWVNGSNIQNGLMVAIFKTVITKALQSPTKVN